MPDRLALLDELDRVLQTQRLGRIGHGYREIDSTNAVALRLASEGAPEGTLVVAESQTAGRGRFRRSWEAAPGLNLLFSVVLRPRFVADRFGLIPLAAGAAVAEAIEAFTDPIRPTIKWPNDVLLNGRKTCGILLETSMRPDAGGSDPRPAVVLGIGVNVNQIDFPATLQERATSLRLETGQTIPRSALFARILDRLERQYDTLARDGGAAVRAAYLDRLTDRGRLVTLRATDSGAAITGRLLGLASDGALRLDVDGRERAFHAGETTFRPAPA